MLSNAAMIIVSILAAGVMFHPRLLKSPVWRATVTPLASIIGSGFLVVGPILSDSYGEYAWEAMLALCAIGYLYGAAMRHNILYVEPKLDSLRTSAATIERASTFMLSLAYFISVAYYLNLFAAFGLRLFNMQDENAIRIAATIAIAMIGIVGLTGGLKALERLEVGAVGLKLSVIAGLIVALALYAASGHVSIVDVGPHNRVTQTQILLGLIVLVQGFETSRYLGAEYDAQTRVRTMRYAQWISTVIYVIFVFLVTHLFRDVLPESGGETAIIDMISPVGAAVAPMLIAAALASQSSAAIADMNGAGGLLAESTKSRLSVNSANLATALVAIGITWSSNIFEIITYASKAFVGYYTLQSLQAGLSCVRRGRPAQAALYAFGVLLAIAVIAFAKPAAA